MTMKTISAREAKNSFGQFLDMAQREPVIVTKRNRPVTVMFSMQDLPAMMDFADQMKAKINAGIERGIADADAGGGHELNEEYIESLKQKLQARIANKMDT